MADNVAGLVLGLTMSGEGQVSAGADRVMVKIEELAQAAEHAKNQAAASAKAAGAAGRAVETFSTRLEVSFQRVRSIASALNKAAKIITHAVAPSDDEANDRVEAATSAITEGLAAGGKAARIAAAIGGPELAAAAGLLVGVGVTSYEFITKNGEITEKLNSKLRQIAREEASREFAKKRKEEDEIEKAGDDYVEAVMKQKAETARFNAMMGGYKAWE